MSSPTIAETVKATGLVVAGYSTAAVALVAFLTINGVSDIPTVAVIGTAVLVTIGLLLPASAMLLLRRFFGPTQKAARYGLAMQGLGLIGLFTGVLLVYFASSVSDFIASAAIIMTSGAVALAGAAFLEDHYARLGSSTKRAVGFLLIGTALMFSGVGLISVSNIAYWYSVSSIAPWYLISQVENTVYVDLGSTVSALGCVLAAYSFFILRSRSRTQ